MVVSECGALVFTRWVSTTRIWCTLWSSYWSSTFVPSVIGIGRPGNEMYFLILKGCSHIFQLTLGSLSILVRDVIEAIWNHLYSAR